MSDLKTLLDYLKEIPLYFNGILSQLQELSAADLTFEECEALVTRKNEAEELIELLGTEGRYKSFQTIVFEPEEEASSLWLSNIERVIRKTGANEYHSSARQKTANNGILRRAELMYLGHAYMTDESEVRDIMSVGNKTVRKYV